MALPRQSLHGSILKAGYSLEEMLALAKRFGLTGSRRFFRRSAGIGERDIACDRAGSLCRARCACRPTWDLFRQGFFRRRQNLCNLSTSFRRTAQWRHL